MNMDPQTIRDLHDLREHLAAEIVALREDELDDDGEISPRYEIRDRERWIAAIDSTIEK